MPCRLCILVRDAPIMLMPTHVVHPEHGKPRVFDVYGIAVCPDCGTRWRAGWDNRVGIVEE